MIESKKRGEEINLETYCLDTDMIINSINGRIPKDLNLHDKNIATTVINVFEINSWESQSPINRGFTKGVLKSLKTYELTKESSIKAGEIRLSLLRNNIKISESDILVASICIENNLTLITNNIKHFLVMREFGLKINGITS